MHPDILHQCILNKTSCVQTCYSLVSEWAPHWHGWSWDTELHSRGRGMWRWQLEGKGLHVTLVIAMIYSIWGKHSGVSSLYSHRASKLTVHRDTEGGNVTLSDQLTIQNTWKRDCCGHCSISPLFTIQCHLSILCLLGLCDTIKTSRGKRLIHRIRTSKTVFITKMFSTFCNWSPVSVNNAWGPPPFQNKQPEQEASSFRGRVSLQWVNTFVWCFSIQLFIKIL